MAFDRRIDAAHRALEFVDRVRSNDNVAQEDINPLFQELENTPDIQNICKQHQARMDARDKSQRYSIARSTFLKIGGALVATGLVLPGIGFTLNSVSGGFLFPFAIGLSLSGLGLCVAAALCIGVFAPICFQLEKHYENKAVSDEIDINNKGNNGFGTFFDASPDLSSDEKKNSHSYLEIHRQEYLRNHCPQTI